MDLSTIARLPVGETPATLFVALELSKATWLVALHSPAADKISLHRLAGGDTQGLLSLIARKRDQAQAALARPVHVMSCYEAGYDGFWLHRLLETYGIDNRVLDAASILVDRRSRRAKTDRLDAAALLRTLMALDVGSRGSAGWYGSPAQSTRTAAAVAESGRGSSASGPSIRAGSRGC
jgi:transposase